jgi:CRP/FNR family cyclic AMP-dependent transcriptional regulator
VARSLAALFHPVLYPGVGELLRITQQELAYLVGLSRQRVNVALPRCSAPRADPHRIRRLRVLDLAGLRSSVFSMVQSVNSQRRRVTGIATELIVR